MEPLDDEVLEILTSLIAFKNRADAKGWRDAFENMPIYMERVGLQADIPKLKVVHVAGTKGKGSTCAMVEAMLRASGYKTGLFTSPHLVDIRERIRINGGMVSKDVFQSHFWECYNSFCEKATADVGVPGYFRFLTLLAFKVFAAQGVDVVVLEVGVGGRLDATNVIERPVCTAITSLGLDHMEMLGDTLPKIAREKAGIMKAGRPAFTVDQPEEAMEVLREVAGTVGAPLLVASNLGAWKAEDGTPADQMPRSLGGHHQSINAGLAVTLCASFEEDALQTGRATPGAQQRVSAAKGGQLPAAYQHGLLHTSWPGRSQVIHDAEFAFENQAVANGNGAIGKGRSSAAESAQGETGNPEHSRSRLSFFIDGAHTPESMVTCADWFSQASAANLHPTSGACNGGDGSAGADTSVARLLVFNCMKERDPAVLLPALSSTLVARGAPLSHAVFVHPDSQYGSLNTTKPPGSSPPTVQLTAPVQQVTVEAAPTAPDYSWQLALQGVWESHCMKHGHGTKVPGGSGGILPMPVVPGLAIHESSRSTVAPSLRATVDWIRSLARSKPQLQVQVLVTGSLYLVGDMLRLLNRAPK